MVQVDHIQSLIDRSANTRGWGRAGDFGCGRGVLVQEEWSGTAVGLGTYSSLSEISVVPNW